MKAIRSFLALSLLMKVGIGIGVVVGGCVGTIVNPPAMGLLLGACVGGLAGAAAGRAMQRDDERGSRRGQELDDIIGVTSGSMGIPPGSIPPGDLRRFEEDGVELSSSLAEWLTPPPPAVR